MLVFPTLFSPTKTLKSEKLRFNSFMFLKFWINIELNFKKTPP